jgi:hypothetical protein
MYVYQPSMYINLKILDTGIPTGIYLSDIPQWSYVTRRTYYCNLDHCTEHFLIR